MAADEPFPGPLLKVRLVKGTSTRVLEVRPLNREQTTFQITDHEGTSDLDRVAQVLDAVDRHLAELEADGWKVQGPVRRGYMGRRIGEVEIDTRKGAVIRKRPQRDADSDA